MRKCSFLLVMMLFLALAFSSCAVSTSNETLFSQKSGSNGTSATAAASSFNYADAFSKSILYFEANWCGPDAGSNRLPWRGACHTNDGADVGLDLTGGYHDCGDHVKFGQTQGYSAATLGWAYYEFKDVFKAKGQDGYMLNVLKHFTDYFLKSNPNPTTFYYQCGDGTTDHSYWGPPELQTTNVTTRPTLFVANPATPGSDVCGSTAAALALMYLNYLDKDATYAAKCLAAAKNIYNLGKNYLGLSKAGGFYGPTGYWDELSWAATWLYLATTNNSYMNDINTFLSNKNITDSNLYNNHWTLCWDDEWGGVFVKLAQITNRPLFKFVAEENLDYWMNSLPRTPAGLCYLNSWGNLRYVAAESMLSLIYYKYTTNQVYLDFAKSQIDYMMGNNPHNYSYIVGYGTDYPKFPHHRASSGRFELPPANETKKDPQKHLLYGALPGGPDISDNYSDDVETYVYTEVGIDYNAGLVGALAGLTKAYGMAQTAEPTPGIEPAAAPIYVTAYSMEDTKDHSTIRAYIHNDSSLPPQYESGLSFRYFFNLSEYFAQGLNASPIGASIYYCALANGKLSPVTLWDDASHVYYVEASWPGTTLYGKAEFQFALTSYSAAIWNAANDFSRTGLPAGPGDIIATNIAVYRNGVKVFGNEPPKGSSSSSAISTSSVSSRSSVNSSAVSSSSSKSSIISSSSSKLSSAASSLVSSAQSSSASSVKPSSASTSSKSSALSSAVSSTVSSAVSSTAGAVKVQFFNGSTATGSNQIYGRFKLINTSTAAVSLSTVKIRYYYTKDGTQGQSFWCDWSTAGTANVTGIFGAYSPVKATADTYLEIGFTAAAGTINPGASVEVQTRTAKTDWSNYNQANDYSFNATATSFVDAPKVTATVSGTTVWGVLP